MPDNNATLAAVTPEPSQQQSHANPLAVSEKTRELKDRIAFLQVALTGREHLELNEHAQQGLSYLLEDMERVLEEIQ